MKPQKSISRRAFLKQGSTALCGVALAPHLSTLPSPDQQTNHLLGRVLFNGVHTYQQPDTNSLANGMHDHNDILPLLQLAKGVTNHPNGEIWFLIKDDVYIHSRDIQLVQNKLNKPREDVTRSGRLGEVTVPFTEAINTDKQNAVAYQLFFYGSVHWIHGLGENQETGKRYYLIIEDRWNESYYVDATHMRIIEDGELAPIDPVGDLERKRILVDTSQQMLYAYQDGELVMASAVSTGQATENANLSTPAGEYFINYKRPTRHMVHSDKIGINDSELYGVPWVSYFTETGIAFHGTYWHNDYTHPRSHGCVNMPIQAAKWIYRWSDPPIAPRAKKHTDRYGTTVTVI